MPPTPAELAFAGDGTPYSPGYEDIYHSDSGGLAQARHVFLGGNDLLGDGSRWQGREDFSILETGFGLGLNFLATWQAWKDDPRRPQRLHYVSVEKHPFRAGDLARLHAVVPELAPLAPQLHAAWPSLVAGFHRLHFEAGAVTLTLAFGDARSVIPSIAGRFDAFYLDGFAPERNPEMWSEALIGDLSWLAAPGATLATWSVAGELKRRLASADFHIAKRPGFGNKRDMLVAEIGDRPRIFESENCGLSPISPISPPRRVAVIGAGIAGIACAERLAARGCEVALFERNAQPVAETSGNHQAILLPVLAVDETRLARLNRVAFLYALRHLDALAAAGHPVTHQRCGVFQIARDADHAGKLQAIVVGQHLPEDFAQYIDADAAAQRVGTRVAGPGVWFPQAGWLSPVSFAQALLASGNLDCRFDANIAGLARAGEGWQVLGQDNTPLWCGDAVVLAHAHGIRALPQSSHLPIRCFRGQVTHLPTTPLGGIPRCVVCREGYLAPALGGIAGLGATFQRSQDTQATIEDHASNLNRLSAMLPAWAGHFDANALDGRVGLRPVSPDKLPMVGALPHAGCEPRPSAHVEWPRWPGLHVATGYGARGFVWAPLMAELLASQITASPLPIEHELAAAVDPARFAWKSAA